MSKIALCLSGGGYRAAAFHLGSLRRLHEVGLLARVGMLSSVSGGSILAAHLAQVMATRKRPTLAFEDWENDVAKPFREGMLRRDIRTVPFLAQWGVPWNFFRPGPAVRSLAKQYQRHLVDMRLSELPGTVDFRFCACDLHYGANWTWTRTGAGDYYTQSAESLKEEAVATAVAASSCFPPVFLPLKVTLPEAVRAAGGPSSLYLSDGGVYDNLGLEPAWENREEKTEWTTVLASDGGMPFTFETGSTPWRRMRRYMAIATNQVGALRKRWLVERYKAKKLEGSYWGIQNTTTDYNRAETAGYTEELVKTRITKIRTDLNGFSDAETGILENHGYLLAAGALKTFVKEELPADPPEVIVPHAQLMDETVAEQALAASRSRKPLRGLLGFAAHPIRPFRRSLPS